MQSCRLVIDPPAAGAWNMAADEVLLENAAAGGGSCWRVYRWEIPTLSLGYFQRHEDRFHYPASARCPLVRRASGGGAILHDAEITYSLALPAEHALAVRREVLYDAVHRSLIDVLQDFGVEARLCGESSSRAGVGQPFLCFQRRSPGDIVVDSVKVVGSAQRRNRGAVLQHGSILLQRSPAAPELPGLNDLYPTAIAGDCLLEAWIATLAKQLGFSWFPDTLSEGERSRTRELVEMKYGCDCWTLDRSLRNPLKSPLSPETL